MSIEETEARDVLGQYGQQHLMRFWDQIDGDAKDSLLKDISEIDFELHFHLC